MRLPVRRVYRAFPELDTYDDERCEAFMRAARGRTVRRTLTGLASWAVGAAVSALWLFVFYRLDRSFKLLDLAYTDWMTVRNFVGVAILGVPLCGAIFCGFVVRDWLLRKRFVYVLRERGSCPGCGYGLIGLAVSADSRVLCPECGKRTEVDPSLGELAKEGPRTIVVTAKELAPSVFWTPGRRRIARRTAVVASLVAFGVAPVAIGVREILIRKQASLAVSDMAKFRAELEAPRSGSSAGGNSPWGLIASARKQLDAVDVEVWKSQGVSGAVYPEYGYIGRDELRTRVDAEAAQYFDWRLQAAEQMVAKLEAGGFYARLDALCEIRDVQAPEGRWAVQNGVMMGGMEEVGNVRAIARALHGRMATARVRGDLETYAKSAEMMRALARIEASNGDRLEDAVAMAIEGLLFDELGAMLRSDRFDTKWCDAVDAALKRQEFPLDVVGTMKREEIAAKIQVASLYSEPKFQRWTWVSGTIGATRDSVTPRGGASPRPRIAGYERTQDKLEASFRQVAAFIALPRNTQLMMGAPRPVSALTLVGMLTPSTEHLWGAYATAAVRRDGWSVNCAIVRFRAETGRLPDNLGELVPKYLGTIPVDPWTGGPLGYQKAGAVWRVFAVGDDFVPGTPDVAAGGTMVVP